MSDEQVNKVDPALFERADMRRVLAALDIGALYRLLGDAGISQRQIAACTGQSQSEVSEIVAGRRRKVHSHEVLVRLAEGFAIPRELMGLSWWGPDGTYAGEVTAAESPQRVKRGHAPPSPARRHVDGGARPGGAGSG
jgi:transcriptional regulator with XRE-family HTH domain